MGTVPIQFSMDDRIADRIRKEIPPGERSPQCNTLWAQFFVALDEAKGKAIAAERETARALKSGELMHEKQHNQSGGSESPATS
jgi:hypothetical protein